MMRYAEFEKERGAFVWGHGAGRLHKTLVVAILSCCLAVFAGTVWTVTGLQRELSASAQRTDRPQPAGRDAATALGTGLPPNTDRHRLNRAIRQLNTPWPDIFGALEAEATDTVAVLSVEPNAERGVVRMLTEGPALDQLLSHASRLGRRAPFHDVRLHRVDEKETDGQHLAHLSFDLVLRP